MLRAPLALLFFLPITLPGLFVGIALLVYFARLDVQLSLVTVVIAHFVYVFPYFLLIAVAALDRLDPALEEAAADLGASPWKVFRKVTLPLIWPVLVGATALAFALSFDEFIITFFVIGPDSTLPMFIFSQAAPHRRPVDQRRLHPAHGDHARCSGSIAFALRRSGAARGGRRVRRTRCSARPPHDGRRRHARAARTSRTATAA